jgi:hypothetical protein
MVGSRAVASLHHVDFAALGDIRISLYIFIPKNRKIKMIFKNIICFESDEKRGDPCITGLGGRSPSVPEHHVSVIALILIMMKFIVSDFDKRRGRPCIDGLCGQSPSVPPCIIGLSGQSLSVPPCIIGLSGQSSSVPLDHVSVIALLVHPCIIGLSGQCPSVPPCIIGLSGQSSSVPQDHVSVIALLFIRMVCFMNLIKHGDSPETTSETRDKLILYYDRKKSKTKNHERDY